jgi:hypothetical protein
MPLKTEDCPAAKFATLTGLIGTITGVYGMFKG